ncbi:uncharacterized protein G2W53_018680 [Senna tora]|uniref:Uncharacterized protein n=1 Tax=Senna tora TaxID=362788 RepID=A0A834TVQ8_9FABA|nr:uncharacterized protein G2W53_018680 [Senna tora]
MAAESNSGFRNEDIDPALNRHAISFQSGANAINSFSEMVPMGNFFGINSTSGMIYSGNSTITNNNNPVISQAGGEPSGSSFLLDSVPGLKHDTAVEWSVDEQYKLEEALVKTRFADEPSIMKYIKIAASLPDKTVRDVALRCRWMTKKRRKPDEYNVGKKVNNRKDKPVELSAKTNLHSAVAPNMAMSSHVSPHMDPSERILYDEGIGGPVRQRLEQNAQAFSRITANLSTYKLQDNIELFYHTRHNISTILHDLHSMQEMPGIMSQMPPLPVSINEDLASNILPNKA